MKWIKAKTHTRTITTRTRITTFSCNLWCCLCVYCALVMCSTVGLDIRITCQEGTDSSEDTSPDCGGDNVYLFVANPFTFDAAQANCVSNGGGLASVKGDCHRRCLKAFDGENRWIGLKRTDGCNSVSNCKSKFKWIDHSTNNVDPIPWKNGHPETGEKLCAHLNDDAKIVSSRCTTPKPSICLIPAHPCESDPCQNGGNCDNEVGRYTCTCTAQYTGVHCEIDVDECSIQQCQNDGSCHNTPGSFICDCPIEWTGFYCESELDPCLSDPCENDGTCINQFTSYTCSCPQPWVGELCRIDINHETTPTLTSTTTTTVTQETRHQRREQTKKQSEKQAVPNWYYYVGGGGLVMLVVIIIVCVLVIKRKRRSHIKSNSYNQHQEQHTEQIAPAYDDAPDNPHDDANDDDPYAPPPPLPPKDDQAYELEGGDMDDTYEPIEQRPQHNDNPRNIDELRQMKSNNADDELYINNEEIIKARPPKPAKPCLPAPKDDEPFMPGPEDDIEELRRMRLQKDDEIYTNFEKIEENRERKPERPGPRINTLSTVSQASSASLESQGIIQGHQKNPQNGEQSDNHCQDYSKYSYGSNDGKNTTVQPRGYDKQFTTITTDSHDHKISDTHDYVYLSPMACLPSEDRPDFDDPNDEDKLKYEYVDGTEGEDDPLYANQDTVAASNPNFESTNSAEYHDDTIIPGITDDIKIKAKNEKHKDTVTKQPEIHRLHDEYCIEGTEGTDDLLYMNQEQLSGLETPDPCMAESDQSDPIKLQQDSENEGTYDVTYVNFEYCTQGQVANAIDKPTDDDQDSIDTYYTFNNET